MFKIQIYRNLLAIATVATLWSLPVVLQAPSCIQWLLSEFPKTVSP